MSLRFVEFGFESFPAFGQPPRGARVLGAKFDCGCEWHLVGNNKMQVYCRIHSA